MQKKCKSGSAARTKKRRAPDNSDLQRLRAAMSRRVEGNAGLPPENNRVVRNALGRLPAKPLSSIRDAILCTLATHGITRYELWKRARTLCPTLPESAVYEFLRGQRAISVTYCESLLSALDLGIAPLHKAA
jgi:hypothetical protein